MEKDYGDNLVSQLIRINELLTEARKRGIQMKQLAEAVNVSPPVLSAFYRTVMPSFMDNYTKIGVEEALDYAFSLVNNISKSRFVPFFPNILMALETILASQGETVRENDKRFVDDFVAVVNAADPGIQQIEGIYRTYSMSSGEFSMKCEPMILSKRNAGGMKVSRLSVHNVIQEGFALTVGNQMLSITLNEAKYPKFYPLSICINIPFCFEPKLFRGVCLAADSSHFPIARRILAEKISNSTRISDFQQEKASIYPADAIPEELSEYFDYIREKRDVLRVSPLPEPTADKRDLIMEKKLIKLYEEL